MIPASHPIQPPEERRALSKWEFATLFLAQMGKCAVCGCRLEKGRTRDEHLHALDLGGGNELTNRALWCLDCTKPKNVSDKARSAKGRRIRGETCNGPKRKLASRSGLGGGKMQGRGFDKPKDVKFDWKLGRYSKTTGETS